jgi:hypothetical protein
MLYSLCVDVLNGNNSLLVWFKQRFIPWKQGMWSNWTDHKRLIWAFYWDCEDNGLEHKAKQQMWFMPQSCEARQARKPSLRFAPFTWVLPKQHYSLSQSVGSSHSQVLVLGTGVILYCTSVQSKGVDSRRRFLWQRFLLGRDVINFSAVYAVHQ